MKAFRGNTVLTFDTENKGAIVLEHMDELTNVIQRWLEKNLQYINFVIPIEASLTTDPVQAMFCGSLARMKQAIAGLAAGDLEDKITILRTEYPGRDLTIVDILNTGCSKGHALERWATHRGIPRGQVMAIGDNYNDVEMLAFAGRPFIMGNAPAELHNRGWTVTRSNAENGVAFAIDQVLDEATVGV
jgi:hydroxymethylpyrimidine pyrophosphatase-like HAD family hydrolase